MVKKPSLVRMKFHNFKSITKWCTTEEIQADVILVNNGKNCSILCERLKLMNQNKITLNRFPIVPTPKHIFCLSINFMAYIIAVMVNPNKMSLFDDNH